MLSWNDFLVEVADHHKLFDENNRQAFLRTFAQESLEQSQSNVKISNDLDVSPPTLQRRLAKVYEAFSPSFPELNPNIKGKCQRLRDGLKREYSNYKKTGILPWQIETPSELSQEFGVIQTPLELRDICRNRLEKQKQLTTNRLMRAKAMVFNLGDFDVDLALVERKKPDIRSEDDPKKSRSYQPDYEETEKLEYQDFLAKVLKSNQSNKIAVIGEAGAGKTTLLQRVAFWILENTDSLPIWISLGNLPKPAPQLKEYLLNYWLEDAEFSITPKMKADFEKQLMAGKVWLLLDGVDEMAASGNPFTFFDQWIPAWSQNLPVILTCRLNIWEANPYTLNGFQTYRTLWFNEEKVKQFIDNGFQKSDPELGIQLQKALNQPGKERIKDLVRNPLRLMLLCSIWHLLEGKLPDTKAELYQHYVEEVYRWKQDETTPEERQQLNFKLGELAKEAIDKQENRFCLQDKFIEGVFNNDSLFQLALKVGWLNEVGVDAKNPLKPVYAFYHPTFQEYFAAKAIDNWNFFLPREHKDRPVYGKRYRIFEPQWKEVILLWLGREEEDREEKEAFIKRIINFNDGFNGKFYWYRAYFLAAAVIAEFRSHFADEIAQQIITWSFDCFYKEVGYFSKNLQDAQFHSSIIEGGRAALPEAYYHKAVEFILPLLEDKIKYRHIRHEAIKTLGVMGTGNCDAIQALNRIIDDPSENICCVEIAACSLGQISTDNLRLKAIKKIIDLMAFDVHKTAVEYLSQLVFESVNIPFDIVDLVVESMGKHIKEIDILLSFFPSNWIIAKAFLKIAPIDHPQYQYATDIENRTEARIKQVEDSGMDELLNDIKILGLGDITAKELESQILKVISHLNLILRTNQDKETQEIASDCLTSILLGQQVSNQAIFLHLVIQGLTDCPDYRIRENYSVLWHCAQNLPYPTFYEAWHDSATTRDPEVPETTADSTPSAQSFNSANLPQVLANAIDNQPDLSNKLKLICIDISKFIDPDNPAQEIYDEILNQNCPEWQNGYPDTMQKLKIYWNFLRRQSENPLFFICYDSTALSATPTGFSDSFLKALSKFDRAICVVCEQENIPLPTFSPSQPDLVAAVVAWIRRSILENRHPI